MTDAGLLNRFSLNGRVPNPATTSASVIGLATLSHQHADCFCKSYPANSGSCRRERGAGKTCLVP